MWRTEEVRELKNKQTRKIEINGTIIWIPNTPFSLKKKEIPADKNREKEKNVCIILKWFSDCLMRKYFSGLQKFIQQKREIRWNWFSLKTGISEGTNHHSRVNHNSNYHKLLQREIKERQTLPFNWKLTKKIILRCCYIFKLPIKNQKKTSIRKEEITESLRKPNNIKYTFYVGFYAVQTEQ